MKVAYSLEKINPFGGLSFVDKTLSNNGVYHLIDQHLGSRSAQAQYTYSNIIKVLWMVTFCGGDCAEDLTKHLRPYLSDLKGFDVPAADTVLQVQKGLSTEKDIFVSPSGIGHEFNINEKMNRLMVKLLVHLGQLSTAQKDLTFDYDSQFIPNDKYDSKRSYKHADGYFPGIASINNMPVYIENRNGNSNVKFKQEETLTWAYNLLKEFGISVKRSRMDCGSFSKEIISVVEAHSELFYIRAIRCDDLFSKIQQVKDWETEEIGFKQYEVASIEYLPFGQDKTYRYVISREKNTNEQGNLFTGDHYVYRAIMTNDREMTDLEVIFLYNGRGQSERLFDEMNNDFNWNKLPFSFLYENTVFMIIMAMCCCNMFHFLTEFISKKVDFVKPTFRLKKIIFRFIIVPAKWLKHARENVMKLFTAKPNHLVL